VVSHMHVFCACLMAESVTIVAQGSRLTQDSIAFVFISVHSMQTMIMWLYLILSYAWLACLAHLEERPQRTRGVNTHMAIMMMTTMMISTALGHSATCPANAFMVAEHGSAPDGGPCSSRDEHKGVLESISKEGVANDHEISKEARKALARKAKRRPCKSAASTPAEVGGDAQEQLYSIGEALAGRAMRKA